MITKCIQCNKEFNPKSNTARKFCSLRCYWEYRNENHKPQLVKNCEFCNKNFSTFMCKVKIGKGKYCSRQCFDKAWRQKSKRRVCPICKNIFMAQDNVLKKGKGIYCSLNCYNVVKKINWSNLAYKEMKMKQMNSRQHIFPNKPESLVYSFLEKEFPKEWKYSGNGGVWFGDKNPDFINVNGQKKLIEVFGDYWHKGENPNDRIQHFGKYGFKTLVLWENEILNKDFKNKVFTFINLKGD